MEVHLRLLGRHFVPNALSAVAAACLFGVEVTQAREALEHFQPFSMRMEAMPLKGGEILINDAYNANPYSMEAALETLAESKGSGRAIAVLGDMLELGKLAKEAHERIGRRVSELSIDFLFAMGEEASVIVDSAIRHGLSAEKAKVVESHSEAISLLQQTMQSGDWILVKGSRRMAMEEIVAGLTGGRI